jgi:hypothetical protein
MSRARSTRQFRPNPPQPWRRFRSAFVAVGGVLFGLATWSLFFTSLPPFRPSGAITILVILTIAGVLLYFLARERVVLRFLRPHRGFVCFGCHYPLRDLPDAGNCPECGSPYARADLVNQWAKHFTLSTSEPRRWISPPDDADATRAPSIPAVVTNPAPPWTGASLARAIESLVAVSKRHGWREPHYRSYRDALIAIISDLPRPFPSPLDAFLSWYDQNLWSWFVNPSRQRATVSTTPESWDIFFESSAPEALDDPIRIRPPSRLEFGTLAEASARHPAILAHVQRLTEIDQSAGWTETRIIVFGDTHSGEPLVYLIAPPEGNPGSIFTFTREADRIWLADSLAEWLARLAAFDGVECVFRPGDIGNLNPQLTAAFLAEFRAHNPRSDLFAR